MTEALETLAIESINADATLQLRVEMNSEIVESYAQDMQEGDVFPPLVVFRDDDGTNWLADGFHRLYAAKSIGRTEILAQVRRGTVRDALAFAATANRKHGLPFSNKDKRRIAELFLRDEEWSMLSDREIARRAGVSDRFVAKLRKELHESGICEYSQIRTVERGGKTYVQNVAAIGRTQESLAARLERYRDLMNESYHMPEAHEYAKVYPAMTPYEFYGLVESIKEHGLREPITLYEGKILDGRMRYLACKEAGVAPQFVTETFRWNESVVGFVASKNLIRFHFASDAQRAETEARLEELEKKWRRSA